MTNAPDPMAEIKASFFLECEELLEALQDGLQAMDDAQGDNETINVVFRAVHSIKGGAGAFGLDALVQFAHRFETILDALRSGRLDITSNLLGVFFRCADHLSDLVRACREGTNLPEAKSNHLLGLLDQVVGASAPKENDAEIAFQPMALALDLDLDLDLGDDQEAGKPPDNTSHFTINFRPFTELFETGNEPHQILRALSNLGDAAVTCKKAQVPTLDLLASDTSYISWTIALETDASENEIASIFEFVEGLCALEIIPAGTSSDFEPGTGTTDEGEDITSSTTLNIERATDGTTSTKNATVSTAQNSAAPPLQPPIQAPPKQNSAAIAAKSVVRVDLERIERLVNLVGELVINQAMLSQSLEKSGISTHTDAVDGLEEFQRLTRDIQDSVMMIRAQPVKSLFQRMSRIVRECSSAVGKNVRLQTEGDATEVDKTVIERLADPLTHMIRNAVDHGLESSEDRLASGKSAQGKVSLTAAHKSGRVVIEVSDDGAGINRPRVRQIAVDKGLITEDMQLSDSDVDNLLFLPGFSTASQISDLSGRGVGMDVVRTEIQSLGGRVTITSTPGQGTCFSVSLPLTLAVLDGMVIQVAQETLVVPLSVVTETLTLQENSVEFLRPGHPVVRVRDQFVPLLDMAATLGYRHALNDFSDMVALLVTQEDSSPIGFVIDSILDQRQVVIKGLHESLYRAPGVAAATILGDGQIALIIDPTGIVEMAADHPCHLPLEGLIA